MKQLALAVAFTVATIAAFAQAPGAINGSWLNAEKDGKVDIYESAGRYYGKLIWIKAPFEADGKTPRKDAKNKDVTLRQRPVLNMVILSGFRFDHGKWVDGEVYDPKSGKTYNSVMSLNGDKLEIRGYVGTPLFGRTTVFTRP